jgi:hypothetical protein
MTPRNHITLYNWKLFMAYLSGSVCGMLYGSGFSEEFYEFMEIQLLIKISSEHFYE